MSHTQFTPDTDAAQDDSPNTERSSAFCKLTELTKDSNAARQGDSSAVEDKSSSIFGPKYLNKSTEKYIKAFYTEKLRYKTKFAYWGDLDWFKAWHNYFPTHETTKLDLKNGTVILRKAEKGRVLMLWKVKGKYYWHNMATSPLYSVGCLRIEKPKSLGEILDIALSGERLELCVVDDEISQWDKSAQDGDKNRDDREIKENEMLVVWI